MIKVNFFIVDIELGFLPWLMNEVDKTMEHSMVGRTVLDSKLFFKSFLKFFSRKNKWKKDVNLTVLVLNFSEYQLY